MACIPRYDCTNNRLHPEALGSGLTLFPTVRRQG